MDEFSGNPIPDDIKKEMEECKAQAVKLASDMIEFAGIGGKLNAGTLNFLPQVFCNFHANNMDKFLRSFFPEDVYKQAMETIGFVHTITNTIFQMLCIGGISFKIEPQTPTKPDKVLMNELDQKIKEINSILNQLAYDVSETK